MGEKSGEGPSLDDVERYRQRALALTTLTASIAGAVAVGLIFSPARDEFPLAALIAGGISFVLLLIGLVCTGYGTILASKQKSDESLTALHKRLLTAVNRATKIGASFSALAFALLAIMGMIAFTASSDAFVSVQFNDIPEAIHSACPVAQNTVLGTVSQKDLTSDSSWLRLSLHSSECSGIAEGSTDLFVPKSSIDSIVRVNDRG